VRGKGDTKTRKSRRVLKLPTRAVYAFRAHRTRQAAERLAAGEMWREHDLVFCREDGTPLDLQECPNGVAVSRGESEYVGSPSWLPWLPRARAYRRVTNLARPRHADAQHKGDPAGRRTRQPSIFPRSP
jgi:hypothetical protein